MALRFAVYENGEDHIRNRVCKSIVSTFIDYGHKLVSKEEELNFILNQASLVESDHYYRKTPSEWIISVIHVSETYEDLKSLCYTVLIRTLANLVIAIVPKHGDAILKKDDEIGSGDDIRDNYMIYCITPEVGFYGFPYNPKKIYHCMMPIVTSHALLKNRVINDLPGAFHDPSPTVKSLMKYGRELDNLGLLPTPFPLQELLSKEDLEHLYSFFQIKGISYGNLSVREPVPSIGEDTFWMTARGVNKGSLSSIGKDILLVSGFEPETQTIIVHSTPDGDPRARVSVDAIEHQLIYSTFPEVKAIVHVHAWMDNIESTFQNHPCGTIELANSVVEKIKEFDHPDSVVIGLKNHGITITGSSLEDIFNRIMGNLVPTVPMYE